MRMHRGSSKGGGADAPPPETLPLSASPPLTVVVEVARGGRSTVRTLSVAPGTLVRSVVREVGHAPEGSAVLRENVSIPLDTPIEQSCRLVVVPTFSGG
jgi:sulfur carrier protein ThiS